MCRLLPCRGPKAKGLAAAPVLAVAGLLAASALAFAEGTAGCAPRAIDEPQIAAAWQTLRVMDCARCHGKDYDGHAAPSIVAYVDSQGRERFDRIVLDGDPPRGMPGYRGNVLVAEHMDGMYRYFLGRARGTVAPGDRPGAAMARADPAHRCDNGG
jgi:hypothetical protein